MGKFEPGQTGNPKGRPLGLERRIREQVRGDIPALVEVLREIALGPVKKTEDGTPVTTDDGKVVREESYAAPKERIAAVKELFDRVLGKPRQSVEVTSEGPAMLLEALGLTSAQRKRREAELEARASESEPGSGADPG